MTTPIFLLEPRLEKLARPERKLRLRYVRLAAAPRADQPLDPHSLLADSANALELILALAGFLEAAREVGVATVSDATRNAERIRSLTRAHTDLDPFDVVPSRAIALGIDLETGRPLGNANTPFASIEPVIRWIDSFVAICPIDQLVQLADSHGLQELGYRCRRAHDGLLALIRRNRRDRPSRYVIAGQAYAEGRLSLGEAAALLRESRPDLLVWLEAHGYNRPLDRIGMTEAERSERLARIRADRIAREGRPVLEPDRVNRDTVASERIEGVDARSRVRNEV